MTSTLRPDEAERRIRLANKALLRALESAPSLDDLSQNDCAVLACLAAGMSHQQIGQLFGISHSTVKNHVAKMRRRIGVTAANRGEGAIAQLAVLYTVAIIRRAEPEPRDDDTAIPLE
jgi:DNA-binding NarL/FixJ family response regulator